MSEKELQKGMTFKVEKRKSKNGNEYCCLTVDFGYRVAVVSFDTAFISEFTDIPIAKLNCMTADSSFVVGKFVGLE